MRDPVQQKRRGRGRGGGEEKNDMQILRNNTEGWSVPITHTHVHVYPIYRRTETHAHKR